MEGDTINMSKKSFKILLILVTILSLISTFSFASDDTLLLTSTEDNDSELIATEGDDTLTTGDSDKAVEISDDESAQSADINEDFYNLF